MRLDVPALLLVPVLMAAGCTRPGPAGTGAGPSPPAATTAAGPGTAAPPTATPGATAPGATAKPAAPAGTYRVTYGWAVPSRQVRVTHPLNPPIAPPPAPPLPYLAAVYAGDHPDDPPGYSRISFYFRGAFPSYEFGYVREVPAEGTGEPIPLPGNAFLRLVFTQAQAHDAQGRSTVRSTPPTRLGFPTLRGYGVGGDFEGHVTYGLGIQVAAGSDQTLPIRVGELRRADGFYIVAVDVRRA